jgi:hypothetical protein
MRDSRFRLYTFRGVKPRKPWDIRALEDLEGDLESKDVGEVSVVALDPVEAQKRAEAARWVRLSLLDTRELDRVELSSDAHNKFRADESLDNAWLPLLEAIEEATLDYALGSVAQITFLSEDTEFHPFGSPYVCVRARDNGEGVVLAGRHNLQGYLPGAKEALVPRGWRAPTNKYQRGYSYSLPVGFTFLQGLHLALGALSFIADYSVDDFLHIQGESLGNREFLVDYHPTPKGQLVYHHLPVGEEKLAELTAVMNPYPGHNPVHNSLSAEERAAFLRRNSKLSGVHDWSDDMIQEAIFHGG